MTDESLYLDLDRTQNGFGFAAEDDMLMNLDGDSFLRDASLILDTTITAAPSSTKAHNADIYARTSRVMHGEKAPEGMSLCYSQCVASI